MQPPNRREADRDKMLAAWGIHHLHLSSAPGEGGFTARGPDLLYAMFQPDDAYLLGIYTHNDWARKELVEVIVNNWPDAGLFLKSSYARVPPRSSRMTTGVGSVASTSTTSSRSTASSTDRPA